MARVAKGVKRKDGRARSVPHYWPEETPLVFRVITFERSGVGKMLLYDPQAKLIDEEMFDLKDTIRIEIEFNAEGEFEILNCKAEIIS